MTVDPKARRVQHGTSGFVSAGALKRDESFGFKLIQWSNDKICHINLFWF
jgi:hypothetical protein